MSIQRGQIYFVNLNPVQDREQAGQRPVLVLSIDEINSLPLVVTVVFGTKALNTLHSRLTIHHSPTQANYIHLNRELLSSKFSIKTNKNRVKDLDY